MKHDEAVFAFGLQFDDKHVPDGIVWITASMRKILFDMEILYFYMHKKGNTTRRVDHILDLSLE